MQRSGEYPDDWEQRRKRVLKRDNYECQQCGTMDTELHVHHTTPISEGGGHELSNLTTICHSCHADEHPIRVKLSTAISESKRVKMKYSSSSGTRVRRLDPYGLELYQGIQYLVGFDHYRNEVRIFRPKRIQWLEIEDDSFDTPTEFDINAYLRHKMDSPIQKFVRWLSNLVS
jgi:predicted DNA-binding transcriptional regulator YafY